MCSSNQNKFIELKDAMKMLEKNDTSIQNICLSDCHLLEKYDSLYAGYEQYDPSHIGHREIFLTKKYKNIEALVTNLDENIIRYIEDIFEIEIKIDFPVLKYKNRVYLRIYLGWCYEFIIELKEPQKATIALIHITDFYPAHREIIEDPKWQDNDDNEEDGIMTIAEQFPVFNGDLKEFIRNEIVCPESAKKDSIEGVVYVSFLIDTVGFTFNHEVVRGIREDVDNEAIRVAKLIKFEKPAFNKGKPVIVSYTVPMKFGK
jgi:protein TonB